MVGTHSLHLYKKLEINSSFLHLPFSKAHKGTTGRKAATPTRICRTHLSIRGLDAWMGLYSSGIFLSNMGRRFSRNLL